jgi:hypothetical protein
MVLNFLLLAVSYLYITHSDQVQTARQQQQGKLIERKLCTTLDSLTALRPPRGSATGNPSRAYLRRQHDVLAQLGRDIGCKH